MTWQNWFSIFIMIASMLTTFSYWQKNVLVIRIIAPITSILIIINYIFTGLYTTIIAEAVIFVSAIVSMFIYRKDLFKNKLQNSNINKNIIDEKDKEQIEQSENDILLK